MIDPTTKLWIRNDGDERAAANGCAFDPLRGGYTVWWIERFCKLYEGEGYAGQPLVLHGCHQCDHSDFYATQEEWWEDEERRIPGPAQAIHQERAILFSECVRSGHRIDWQYECFMRIFSWARQSEKWGRMIRRFRQSCIFVPKKSKKSPTLAALGMYLLCGDGEPGQKVFLAAKDGDQARKNTAKHTVEMLYQCPELYDKENPRGGPCRLNLSTLQISHEPSRSVMYPLSSSNSRTQQSKEGLNGSVLVDEVHVVDRPFVNIINRAGISRSESLFGEFSTAGNNPDGYGKERCDYCADVLAGKREDEELFAAIYAAPQDVTDAQLDKDFDHYAAMANPSLGHTIDPQEIRSDYERSKVSIEKLATFKMYRLNVWQHSSNPWLRPSNWAACKVNYTEADLLGRPCWAAMDLSLRWDTSAVVLVFPWDETDNGEQRFRLWPYFFLPEKTAVLNADAAWQTWKAGKHITLTSGETIDFPLIRRTINQCAKDFDLQEVAYDEKYAAHAQDMQDEDGLVMTPFTQSPKHFAEPLAIFEAGVISRRIEHPGNPVLDWQAGNATLGRNGMLFKPLNEIKKKIDGIVAAVMAVGRASTSGGPSHSYYDSNPLEIG